MHHNIKGCVVLSALHIMAVIQRFNVGLNFKINNMKNEEIIIELSQRIEVLEKELVYATKDNQILRGIIKSKNDKGIDSECIGSFEKKV